MKYYVVDAFTSEVFKGNPAGVCLADEPLEEERMQKIAFENNLAETAFLTPREGYYDLRWFTPKVEIDLCGHATLASSYVVLNDLELDQTQVRFQTKSGLLGVKREGNTYKMDFPRRKPVPCEVPEGLSEALGIPVAGTYRSRDLLVLAENESAVRDLVPDFSKLERVQGGFAFIVTSGSKQYDFVSRFFAPNAGIDEDPVTGSSHSTLIPFWSERLGKNEMVAAQLSQRGGVLYCKDDRVRDRVEIGGEAVCYLVGEIVI